MKYKVALAQIAPTLGDVEKNVRMHDESIRRAKDEGCHLIVFPELSLTGYFLKDQVSTVSLSRDSDTLRQFAKCSKDISIVLGYTEESEDFHFYNAAAYLEDGEIKHVHRKVYLPTYGMFDERRYLADGDRMRAFETKFGRTAMMICEDMWHPSLVYVAAQDGAKNIIGLSASPSRGVLDRSHSSEEDSSELGIKRAWEQINLTYACFFQLNVLFCNRCGYEDGVNFWGGSEIISPFAERIAKGKPLEADWVTAELDTEDVREERIFSPLLRDEKLWLTLRELRRIYDERSED